MTFNWRFIISESNSGYRKLYKQYRIRNSSLTQTTHNFSHAIIIKLNLFTKNYENFIIKTEKKNTAKLSPLYPRKAV